MRKPRKIQRLAILISISSTPMLMAGACSGAEEFRAVASGQIQSGLTSIATGLIDGIFAVIEPDAPTDAN